MRSRRTRTLAKTTTHLSHGTSKQITAAAVLAPPLQISRKVTVRVVLAINEKQNGHLNPAVGVVLPLLLLWSPVVLLLPPLLVLSVPPPLLPVLLLVLLLLPRRILPLQLLNAALVQASPRPPPPPFLLQPVTEPALFPLSLLERRVLTDQVM